MSALKMAKCLLACLVVSVGFAGTAMAAAQTSPGSSGLGGNPLVVPGMQPLVGGQQTHDAEEALRDSPEAFVAREVSRTAFEHLTDKAAGKLASQTFPALIGSPAGALPPLPAGERIVGYPNDNAAQIDLARGKHGVIESTEPIAVATSSGHREPLDLALKDTVGGFSPQRASAGLHIPTRLADGIRLSGTGISLTPVDAGGSSLGGAAGAVDGATVIYANTQTDADTVVKPLPVGFEESTLLRSSDSPSRLFFDVGLPSGDRLVLTGDGGGTVKVIDEGDVIAVIPAPTARDAEGLAVPVRMTLSGHTIALSVNQQTGDYRYPIAVDPTVVEKGNPSEEVLFGSTWGFYTTNPTVFKASKYLISGEKYGAEDVVSNSIVAGERAFFYYPTQGQSRIYAVTANTSFSGFAGSKMEDVLGIENVHTGTAEASKAWIENYGVVETLCALSGCATGTVTESTNKSEVFFTQDSRETKEFGGGTAKLIGASVDILQEAGPSAAFIPIEKWIKNNEGVKDLQLNATDPGLGVSSSEWSSPGSSGWNSLVPTSCSGVQCEECYTTGCTFGPLMKNLAGLPEGEDVVEAIVKDPVGLTSTAKTTVKIDNVVPFGLTLTGFPATHEIGFGHYLVKVSATDGTGTTPSSGIASIALAIDGKEVGSPKGSCTPGPCTGTGEWTVNGEEYAAGKHTFVMTATDGAGNVTKSEFPLTIDSSETRQVGPGSADLTSGAYTLGATDVSVAAAGGGLNVSRSYNSRQLTAGAEGPLGPQWSGLGLGGTQSLTKLPTGSMLLTVASGRQLVFAKEGTKFVTPGGDLSMTLKEEGTNTFVLSEQNGTVTTFTLPTGSSTLFVPSQREEKGYAKTVKYTYQRVAGVTEPTQALAPVPAGVTCTTLVKGCRALSFSYATSTTATGEGESQWGDYTGRLKSISFTAWDPSKSEMTTTALAQYSYDVHGRLRAEWDPRISPALKTRYGYDAEGHVTALTSPGRETWAFTYTSIASDPNSGRIVKAMQAPAATALWNGAALTNSELPKLSGTAMVANRMAVSNGTWSNGPVTYGYQWNRCNATGTECAAITGAINPNYTPVESDVGHALTATVRAVNGDGSLTASTVASGVVGPNGSPTYMSTVVPGKFHAPGGVAVDAKGNIWVTDTKDNQVEEFNESGQFVRRVGSEGTGNGQFKGPTGIAISPSGKVWVVDTGNNRVEEFNENGEYAGKCGSEGTGNVQFKAPTGIAFVQNGYTWMVVADTGNNRVQELSFISTVCVYINGVGSKGTGNGQFVEPKGVATDSKGNIWVADTSNNRMQEFNNNFVYQKQFGTSGEGAGQFKLPGDVEVDSKGNIWVADTSNNRVQEFNESGEYRSTVGSKGINEGNFELPAGLAVDSKSDLWVADTANNRVQEFTEKAGEYSYAHRFGSLGTGGGQFEYPGGVAVASNGNVSVMDESATYKVERFNEKGEYLSRFGTEGAGEGQLKSPEEALFDSKNNLWLADTDNNRIEEFSESGGYLAKFGSAGTGAGQFSYPWGVALDTKGHFWVADTSNQRVQEFNEKGEFIAMFGFGVSNGEEKFQKCTSACRAGNVGAGNGQFHYPDGIATDSKGHIWVADTYNNRLEEFSESGEFLTKLGSTGKGTGQFERPVGIATDFAGDVWVTDTENGRVQEFNESGEYLTSFGSKGEGTAQFEFSPVSSLALDAKGNVWITNTSQANLEHWQIFPRVEGEARPAASGWTVSYGVPVSGAGAPYPMSAAEQEKWAQKDNPTEASAIFPPDEPQGSPASDYKRAAVYYLDNRGRTVNVASPGGAISTSEYNATNDEVRSLTPDNRVAALKEGAKSVEASQKLDTQSTYNGEGTELQSTLGPKHAVKLANGKEVQARSHTVYSYDEGVPAEGGPYGLVTKVAQGAQIEGESEQDLRTTTTAYSGQENLGWKLRKPTSVTTDPSGLKLTHSYFYDSTTGNVTETRLPASKGASEAHDTKTIYYTTAANSEFPSCGGHAEWANLTCEVKPAAQPGTGGLPELPVTTTTYNVLDEPETTTQTVGATTRTTTAKYDGAGRIVSSAVASSVGSVLPTITYEYNTETGTISKASTEGKAPSVSSIQNRLGQTTSYTDASGNVSTFEYEPEGDARLTKMGDGKGTQTFTYDPTTGSVTKLADSAAGTFTASYDVEGNLASEGYPNGMSGIYTYNATDEALGLEYVKTTHCTEKCTWYSDALVPSIHGQALSQTSTLASQSYTYDNASRLTQVQETPAGKGCMTRVYAYDEDTNRTSLTVREPGAEGKCTAEGGAKETHTYDSADRLIDSGVKYETFGNVTNLPASDAGGSELTSSFYTNNHLASQTQNGETIGYQLDPARRVEETISTGKVVATVINHYAGAGNTPAWTSEPSGKWTRNIEGIGVGLAALQYNGETPVLQLTDLKGNIVATAAESETETKLLGTSRTTEYGVPTTETPAKYSWLGAHELPTELPSGIVGMGARSYVPQLGRFLQTDPQPGGSANAYAYTYGDPVGSTDLSGEYTVGGPSQALINGSAQAASEAAAEQAAINAAARAEAERKAEEAAGGEEWGEWEEEEWEEGEWEEEENEEYASYRPALGDGGWADLEGGLSWRPFGEEADESGGHTRGKESNAPICEEGQTGPCVRSVRYHDRHTPRKKRKKSGTGKTVCDGAEVAKTVVHGPSVCTVDNPNPNIEGTGDEADPNAPVQTAPAGEGGACPRDENGCRV